MKVTSSRAGLDGAEMATTAVAVAVSTGCWLVFRDPYLARGVVGDSLGFAVLAVPLVRRGQRARHEALVCLAGIAGVVALGWEWPLALPSVVWWGVIATDLAWYLTLRRTLLR